MSSPGTPSLPKNFNLTGDAALDGLLLKGILLAASAATPWLMSHLKLSDPAFAIYLTGALVSILSGVATFVWGGILSRLNQARAVQAGMALQASGASIMVPAGIGLVTPKAVTASTAQEIVKNFADLKVKVPEAAASDMLNELSAQASQRLARGTAQAGT